jgi:hypothetical protein
MYGALELNATLSRANGVYFEATIRAYAQSEIKIPHIHTHKKKSKLQPTIVQGPGLRSVAHRYVQAKNAEAEVKRAPPGGYLVSKRRIGEIRGLGGTIGRTSRSRRDGWKMEGK